MVDAQVSPSASSARIYFNANIITLDAAHAKAWGVRIDEGRITHVLDDEQSASGLEGERVDLAGATVLPGLVDAHFHLRGLGASARRLNFRGTKSKQEVLAGVTEAAKGRAEGEWIRGRGWDQNDWSEKKFPTAADADAVISSHPVWMTRIDGHAVWLNSKALEVVGIDAETKDPEGGEILKNAKGEPTGILIDNAIDLARKSLPTASAEELRADLEKSLELCVSAGLTAIHDMGTSQEELAALRQLQKEGKLTLRLILYLDGSADEIASHMAAGPSDDGLIHIRGVKIYSDGALGSRGAALIESYSDRKDTKGLLLASKEKLQKSAQAIHDAGMQLAIHAIGDLGNRVTLDIIEAVQGKDMSRLHRVEHAQIIHPSDIERFAKHGAVASMQPTHATSDMPWAETRLGKARLEGAYAWKSLLKSGSLLALGSDAPVEEHNPWLGIYAAITRQDSNGQPEGGWLPEQRLSILETLGGFTVAAAQAGHQSEIGMIKKGYTADLTIIDRDPMAADPIKMLETKTLRTVVGGREVYLAK